jgi:hypothetical protein
MSKKKIRCLILAVISLPLLGIISYLTTHICSVGVLPKGVWRIKLVDSESQPISGAKLILDFPDYNPSAHYIFENYKGPGSITSDQNGILVLENTKSRGTGNTSWDLFWIYPIGGNTHPASRRYVLISAPGYETVALSPEEIFEKEDFIVRLKKTR